MTLLSLYRGVAPNYLTFSWAMAAGLFFALSLILHNVKYRWLAIAAMIAAVIYFFIFDLRQVNIGFRVFALLVIAIISLSFSTYYARKMKKDKEEGS
jgi:membrane protein implicated in regulation of membrane protease activity